MERWSNRRGEGRGIKWLRAHIDYTGDDCLPWPMMADGRVGRGRVGYNGEIWWSHRLMCTLAHGEPPTSKHQAAHNCGNGHTGCCNPRHLEWKTNQQNSVDRSEHGRGSRPGKYRTLDKTKIARLKARKGLQTQTSAAKEFGCSLSLVQYHWHGKDRWPSKRNA